MNGRGELRGVAEWMLQPETVRRESRMALNLWKNMTEDWDCLTHLIRLYKFLNSGVNAKRVNGFKIKLPLRNHVSKQVPGGLYGRSPYTTTGKNARRVINETPSTRLARYEIKAEFVKHVLLLEQTPLSICYHASLLRYFLNHLPPKEFLCSPLPSTLLPPTPAATLTLADSYCTTSTSPS